MTIAITIKVFDGVVLAADSAATMQDVDSSGAPIGITTVYNNANKVFNLRKGLPIGAVTWGLGNIGVASTATLMKELRARLTSEQPGYADWVLDPDSYTMEQVAQRLFELIYTERYLPVFSGNPKSAPLMGFMVSGYSSGEDQVEEYLIDLQAGGICQGPVLQTPKDVSGHITWHGQPEAMFRLILGFGTGLPGVLEQHLGVPSDQIPQVLEVLRQTLSTPLVTPGMPIQDALDLADFLADLTARYSRFTPGPATVGGPIELAAITRYEGFKWVKRKHYYHGELNPGGDI